MKKILFLHGFYASGQCPMARALKQAFSERAEVRNWYVPLAEQQLEQYPRPADGTRYFQHFKSGHYRYVGTAFHSETRQRMVVYQALYGEQQYWVRPESMFFETIERDGRQLVRFQEVEKF